MGHTTPSAHSFDPETLSVLYAAFDQAWAEIDHHFRGTLEMEAARLRLANAILAVAEQGSQNSEDLKTLALQTMVLKYRCLRGVGH